MFAVPGPTIFRVDAFTDRPFAGNAAAVCLLESPAEAGWLQAVAREMNAPATAFVQPGSDPLPLRWFSPTVELELCGHGTLAAAHVLWEEGVLPPAAFVRFTTRAGLLTAERRDGWVELDFPAEPPMEAETPAALAEALNVMLRYVGRNRLDYLVEVDDESTVRQLSPDLARLSVVDTRGVIVTSAADGPWDFVSRFFAPRVGIPEDSVTGSAHCGLGPFWSARLGRSELLGYQASARGGLVRVRSLGGRALIGGWAVSVARARLA
jgi:PhzF family phenazine biosynthesis protein